MSEYGAYIRVNGNVVCSSCEKPYNNHRRVKRYDSVTNEELWLIQSCDGVLLKT